MRAIQDDSKSQTRRLLAPATAAFGSAPTEYWHHGDFDRAWVDPGFGSGEYLHVPAHTLDPCAECHRMGWVDGTAHRCRPRVSVNDRLYVRETWGTLKAYDHVAPRDLAPNSPVGYQATQDVATWCQTGCNGAAGRWRPGIHMPRWASRLALEVAAVRVQRLQAITEDDAIAEGVTRNSDGKWWLGAPHRIKKTPTCFPTAVQAFASLWDSINRARVPWSLNPWVIAITFRRLECAA